MVHFQEGGFVVEIGECVSLLFIDLSILSIYVRKFISNIRKPLTIAYN